MKNVLKLSTLVFIITIMFACGSSDNSNLPPQERIQGEWEIYDAEGTMSDLNKGTIYNFEGNIMTTGGVATGEFIISDSTIVWNVGTIQMNYDYHFEDENLVLELNSGQVLYLKKQ